MPYTYQQSTGNLTRNGKLIAKGFSGHGAGLNNPARQGVRAEGPLPRGRWHIDGVYNSAKVGPFALVLSPAAGTDTLGRSGFRIHGNNAKGDFSSSDGCLIFPRAIREQIWQIKDYVIDVVE